MQPEKPRARRYAFAASIELVDLESDVEIREQTSDLSLFGCQVVTANAWKVGTKVRIRVSHHGNVFTALGRVVNVRTKTGMGVTFTKIEPNNQIILEKWVSEIRDARERPFQSV